MIPIFYRSHVIDSVQVKRVVSMQETTALFPKFSVNKKTTRVKPSECSACGKVFMHHLFLNRHISRHNGHKLDEYQKYEEKPYKCKECSRPFSYLQCFEKHK